MLKNVGIKNLIPDYIKGLNGKKAYYFNLSYVSNGTLNSNSWKYEFILKAEGRYEIGELKGVNFTIGGKGKRNCIEGSVIKSMGIGILDTVAYHEGCALNQMFIEGHSMIIVKVMMDIIRKYYPCATKTKIEDLSSTPCGNTNVYYHMLLIAFRGQTWYESNLGAIMGDEEKYKKYRESIVNFENTKLGYSFGDFCQFYSIDSNNEVLRQIYIESKTYKDFINGLKQKYLYIADKTKKQQRDNFCSNVMPWLEKIMMKYIYFETEWFVDMKSRIDPFISGYEIKQLNSTPDIYKASGGSKSKKVSKKRLIKSNMIVSVIDD